MEFKIKDEVNITISSDDTYATSKYSNVLYKPKQSIKDKIRAKNFEALETWDSKFMTGDDLIKFGMIEFLSDNKLEYDPEKHNPKHVLYNKKVNDDFQCKIIKSIVHDGALFYDMEQRYNVFLDLLLSKVICKEYEELIDDIISHIDYEIGDLTITEEYDVQVEGRSYPMMRSAYELPIKCKIVYKY